MFLFFSFKLSARERTEWLMEAMDYLPEQQRKILSLRYLEGLSVAETAQRLSLGESAVKMATLRALKYVAERFKRRE